MCVSNSVCTCVGACLVHLQLANLLDYEHPKQLLKTDFTRFLAQPFMQLHYRWMRVSVT